MVQALESISFPAQGAGLPSRYPTDGRLAAVVSPKPDEWRAGASSRAICDAWVSFHCVHFSGTFTLYAASRRGETDGGTASPGGGVQGKVSAHHQGDESGRGVGDDHEPWTAGRGAVAGAGAPTRSSPRSLG